MILKEYYQNNRFSKIKISSFFLDNRFFTKNFYYDKLLLE
jgi:hypothetical protein